MGKKYNVDTERLNELRTLAAQFIAEFKSGVLPVIRSFGLNESAVIKRCINSTSFSEIYTEAMKQHGKGLQVREAKAGAEGVDFWKPLRAEGCKARTPRESGFQFRSLPLANNPLRQKVLRAISYEAVKYGDTSQEAGKFVISDTALEMESLTEEKP